MQAPYVGALIIKDNLNENDNKAKLIVLMMD